MGDDYEDKYTKPDLRRRLKEEIEQSDRGGEPGQWSARKSQLLVQEYEEHGGGYKGEKDEAARSLEEWTDQDWQTQEGSAEARDGEATSRYLPKKAWAMLTDAQRRHAERTKRQADREGEQHADWPDAVKKAMWALGHAEGAGVPEPTKEELQEWGAQLDVRGRSSMTKDELVQALRDADVEPSDEPTKEELYERAQELDVKGRSQMNKEELRDAVAGAQ